MHFRRQPTQCLTNFSFLGTVKLSIGTCLTKELFSRHIDSYVWGKIHHFHTLQLVKTPKIYFNLNRDSYVICLWHISHFSIKWEFMQTTATYMMMLKRQNSPLSPLKNIGFMRHHI